MPAPPPYVQTEIATLLARGHRTLLGSEPAPAALSRLCGYFDQLYHWNRRINLVARDTPENWVDSHFLDSMVMVGLAATAKKMADIGSGAGFPALVIKCLLPHLPVTMIEPRGKRAVFLRQTGRVLGLDDLAVEEKRAEAVAESGHGPFDLVTSRALAEAKDFLRLAAPLCGAGGIAATLKGDDIDQELQRFEKDRTAEIFRLRGIRPYTLPLSGRRRNILIFEKKK